MDIAYTLYDEIGVSLAANNSPFYLQPERWLGANPMESLTVPPGTENFFGPKVLNLFVVGVPYGWEFVDGVWQENWPPDGFLELVELHKQKYAEFTSYRTYIWMDFNIVTTVMTVNPDSRFQEMMEATEARMQELCTELAAYGFMFMGRDPTEAELQALVETHKVL